MTDPRSCAAIRELVTEIPAALGPATDLAKLVDAALWLRSRSDLIRAWLQFMMSHPDQLAAVAEIRVLARQRLRQGEAGRAERLFFAAARLAGRSSLKERGRSTLLVAG
jgi:Arc/MetJ-type ribon-helix-helix transcriptional regulator